MLKNCFQKRVVNTPPISPIYTKLDSEQVEKNGILMRQNVYRVCDNSKEIHTSIYDFCLENLLALGNPDLFREVNMSDMSINATVESFQKMRNEITQSVKKEADA